MECIHSEDNVKKVEGIKVPEDSALEEKSFPSVRKWDVPESREVHPSKSGNTTAEINTQGAQGQSAQENSKSLCTVLIQLNLPVP